VSGERLCGVPGWHHARRSSKGIAVLGWIDGQLPWWITGPVVGLCVVAL
jgi:hypothetical protein